MSENTKPLNAREALFVDAFMLDPNPQAAALAAGYSATVARSKAYVWVSDSKTNEKPHVRDEVRRRQAERAKRVEVKADAVLTFWNDAMNADPNDLVEYRRVPCRHCYGEGGRFQMTPAEDEERRRAHAKDVAAYEHIRKPGWAAMPDYDPMGGAGYDKRKPINPDCTECHGSGTGEMLVKDTRHLTPEALSIYAGVKQTKDGVEIKLHDKAAIAERVARHLGMFKDSVTVEVTGFAEALQRARRRAGRVTDEDEK